MATPIPINQCEFTLAEVVEATGGTRDAGLAGNIVGVSIDTRSLKAGALFVALRGAASDGHDYLAQAAALGARLRASSMTWRNGGRNAGQGRCNFRPERVTFGFTRTSS